MDKSEIKAGMYAIHNTLGVVHVNRIEKKHAFVESDKIIVHRKVRLSAMIPYMYPVTSASTVELWKIAKYRGIK